jgi:hypothetical protein
MVSVIRPTHKHINSAKLSLSKEHIESFMAGHLSRIEILDQDGRVIQHFQGRTLELLIGSAISNGAIVNEDGSSYYLGTRHKFFNLKK